MFTVTLYSVLHSRYYTSAWPSLAGLLKEGREIARCIIILLQSKYSPLSFVSIFIFTLWVFLK